MDASHHALTAPFHRWVWLLWLWCGTLAPLAGAADLPEWRHARSGPFRAAPVAAAGPYALFGPEAAANRVVRFGALSAEDCVRFHRTVMRLPLRAARWTEAQGALTRELVGRAQPVADAAGPTDFALLPEPELLLIYSHGFRSAAEDAAQAAIRHSFEPFARRVRRVYPGRVEVVVATARPDATGLPLSSPIWMTADVSRLAEVASLRGFITAMPSGVVLMTRHGVPLAGGGVSDFFTLARMLDHISALLWDLDPENRRTLPDRTHYRRAVRAAEFATGTAPPELLTPPFGVELLRRLGVSRLAVRLELDATGKVTALRLMPESVLPDGVVDLLFGALRGSEGFVPAVRDGQPVAGTFDYSVVVPPPPEPRFAAETAWVQGEARVRVPIASWLVLRPIRIDERVLTTVNRVGVDGTVVLDAVKAGTAQVDSLREDWFDRTGGPASVQPVQGQPQEIGEERLVWERVAPVHDFVDLARNAGFSDASVGYAWTEVEVPAETEAWLGLGSDDGHKVWVNGRLVAEAWSEQPNRLDDEVIPLRLKAGRNQILLKIQNETAAWGFIARLRMREQ